MGIIYPRSEETGRWSSSKPAGVEERDKEERREIGVGGEIIEAESEVEKELEEISCMRRRRI